MIEPELHGQGFPAHLAQFKQCSEAAVSQRGEAARQDIATSDWVVAQAHALFSSGELNLRTGKPHSWTSAEGWVKDLPEYRERQRASLALHASAEQGEADARAAWLACRYLIAVLEGSPRASPEMLPHAKERE